MDILELGTTSDGRTIGLPLKFANRHGVVTGATGTGKTVTLQRMAEQFSAAGVPVFAADVKGDLSGIATGSPAVFWDVFGRKGHPIRTSVQEIGATLMARMLGLNEVQSGALAVLFARAEDRRQFILTLEDLRWTLVDLAEDREAVSQQYGNVTAASINTIQRQILALEAQGAGKLFGEPAFDVMDFLMPAADGRGPVNLLWADKLMEAPKLYGTLLLCLLTELYRRLPEVGDQAKPKLVFFFDEAHLLFKDAPKPLLGAYRAGGAAGQVEGRRGLLRQPEPGGHSRFRPRPARQPRPACLARLYGAGSADGQGGREELPAEQGGRRPVRRAGNGRWRSPGVLP
jgi:DNA helicase HerA-like ATPase